MPDPAPRPKIPIELRWLACCNLAIGVTAAINLVLGIVERGLAGISIDFGVLYLFVGFGLLGLFRGARRQALWLTIVVPAVLAPVALITGARVQIHGHPAGTWTTALVWTVFLAMLVWDWRVLTSPRVKALYHDEHFLDRLGRQASGD